MQQAMSAQRNEEPNPLDSTGLCLLSLDGGGVRGLSTLYILKSIMERLNNKRKTASQPLVKPCEVFDLIGGTSTGGLFAIMLGRLEMDVDECIEAYTKLAEAVFSQKKSRLPFNLKGKVKAQFDSSKLEKAIRETIKGSGISETDLFNDGNERGCRTFVCAVDQNTKSIVRLRSYALSDESNIPASICQVALATSAATTFFEPVRIGHRKFADGGLGGNNPVDEVEGEAANIWCSETADLKPLVKCFLSIGTGNPGTKAFEENIFKLLGQTMVDIATETEDTETRFIAKWRKHYGENRYFRFNIDHGLQNIGLDEYTQQGAMESATERYLVNQAQKNRVRDCINNLELKENKTEASFAVSIEEYKNSLQQIVIPKVKWIVPFERNSRFTGRESELTKLEKLLFTEGGPKKIAVIGLGGVGKTSLTIELVYRIRQHQEDCSIFWIPATNSESLQQAYLDICTKLQLPGCDSRNEDPKRLLQRYLSQASAGQWLLVFDNADDIHMWNGSQESDRESSPLKDHLPTSQRGHIVFTSRDRKTAYGFVQRSQHIVEVPELSEDVAIELLQKYVPKLDPGTSEEDAKSLLEKLTYLPLAIVQAASYINQNNESLATYLSLLADQEEEVVDLLSEHFEDDSRYRDVKNPVAMTWLISFEQIRVRDPLSAKLLSFIACIDSKDVPLSLLPPGLSRKKEIDAVGTLEAYAFVSKRQADLSLDVHRLVHLATRNWLRRENSLVQWTETVINRLDDVFPDQEHQNRSVWRRYLAHAQFALNSLLIDQDGERRIDLAWKVGSCLDSDGRWKEAETLVMQVMGFRKKVLGEEHPDTLTSMNNLALVFNNQGKYDLAEPLSKKTIELRKKVLGNEHPDTLTSIDNLAVLFKNQGNYEAAEPLFTNTLRLRKEVLGEKNPDTLVSINNLAVLFESQGKHEAAEPLFEESLRLMQNVLGEEHPDTLTSMNNLAYNFGSQGKHKAAESLYEEVLKLMQKVFGEEHPRTLTIRENYAVLSNSQGKYEVAEELFKDILKSRKKVFGEEHPETLTSMNNLASTFHNQGKYKEAESLYKDTLQLLQKVCGEEHPHTLMIRNNLAILFESQGKYKAAVEARSGRRAPTEAGGVISVGTPQTCIICMNMTGPKLKKTYKIINFYETASTGCPFCRLVCDLWDHAINADWRMLHENFQNRVALSWKDDGPAEIEFLYPFTDGPEYLDGEKNRVYAVSNPSPEVRVVGWESLGISKYQNGISTNGELGWVKFAKQAIHDCVGHHHDLFDPESTGLADNNHCDLLDEDGCENGQGHPECRPPPYTEVPTRLIEINNASDDTRVIETKSHTQIQRYAALSHCWGPPDPELNPISLITTRQNYDQMTDKICWKLFPTTFKNAITVCRQLGIRYLWIDSLCIIQKDKADWGLESGRMLSYYGNAHVTISASCSATGAIHFLPDPSKPNTFRHPPIKLPFHYQTQTMGTSKLQIRRLALREYTWMPPTRTRGELEDQAPTDTSLPILSRAWVFQENSLSARVLHFASHDLFFECKHELRSQSGVLPRGTRDTAFSRIKTWHDASEDTYTRWRQAVKTYFPLRLTQLSDRLPGMSGLAQAKHAQLLQMQPAQEHVYLAGLWAETLARDLCWRIGVDGGVVIQPYVAPSWTWASIEGEELEFMANRQGFTSAKHKINQDGSTSAEDKPFFVQAHITPKDANSIFGEIEENAFLTLYASVLEMELSVTPSGSTVLYPGIEGVTEEEFCVRMDTRRADAEVRGKERSRPVSCMLLGEETEQLRGLILEGVSSDEKEKKRAFKRIGFFWGRDSVKGYDYDADGKFVKVVREDVRERVQKCRQAFERSFQEIDLY